MANWTEIIYLGDLWSIGEGGDHQLIADRIKASRWYKERDQDGFDDLGMLVEDVATAENSEEFNFAWDEIYNLADQDGIWIDLLRRQPTPHDVPAAV